MAPPAPRVTGIALLTEVDHEVDSFLRAHGQRARLQGVKLERNRLTIVLVADGDAMPPVPQ